MRFHAPILPALLAAALASACGPADDSAPRATAPVPEPVSAPPPAPLPEPDTGPDPAATTPASITIPVRYHGTWAADAEACADGGDITHLVIRASTVEFYESTGEVLAVEAGDGRIDATLQLTGEGETWEDRYGFRLSDDGQTLTDTGSGLVRVRCG